MAFVTVRIGESVIDCSDPVAAAEFWCEALGYRITDQDHTGVAIAGDSAAPTILLITFIADPSRLIRASAEQLAEATRNVLSGSLADRSELARIHVNDNYEIGIVARSLQTLLASVSGDSMTVRNRCLVPVARCRRYRTSLRMAT